MRGGIQREGFSSLTFREAFVRMAVCRLIVTDKPRRVVDHTAGGRPLLVITSGYRASMLVQITKPLELLVGRSKGDEVL